MSFTCQGCGTPQAPTTTPHKIIREEREVTYLNEGRPSNGREIMKELSLCHKCAELPPPRPQIMSPIGVAGFSATKIVGAKDHRRRCKDYVEDCKVCQDYLRMSAMLPAHFLSLAVENTLTAPFKVSFAAVAFAAMQDRTHATSRRAAHDVNATYKIMGPFATRGGKL